MDRPRRLRYDGIRDLVSETQVNGDDLVAPIFVDATAERRIPIDALPGQERIPLDEVVARGREVEESGVTAVMLFGIPETKDAEGTGAWTDDGVIQMAVSELAANTSLTIITDVCLCEYTDHGHCGILAEGADESAHTGPTVDNDATLPRLADIAVSHAAAGADIVAPSGMMDGMVATIREALDGAGHENVSIMSYAVKYHSAFYGPFREAADGAPSFGDRRHYQMDPANRREAQREARQDVTEGADIIMVKPALPYLDIIRDVRDTIDQPVAAYHVSGEYAMIHAAGQQGWLDIDDAAAEALLGIKRAGADVIVTYFAEAIASQQS